MELVVAINESDVSVKGVARGVIFEVYRRPTRGVGPANNLAVKKLKMEIFLFQIG